MPAATLDPALGRPAAWLALAVSYLLGAVPFGLLLTRVVRGTDLRTVGSGNIGATNAARALGRWGGLVVFVLDFAKGWAPVALIGPAVGAGSLPVACGLAAVLGHCFPVWLGFRGGKGVATSCGMMVGLDPAVFLVGGLTWLLVAATARMVSLASLAMGTGFLAAAWVRHPDRPLVPAAVGVVFLLFLVRHRANISRMRAGTEPRIGASRGSSRGEPPGGSA